MHRVAEKFKPFIIKTLFHQYSIPSIGIWDNDLLRSLPNCTSFNFYETICCLLMLLLLYIQLHDWLYRIASNLQCLILMLGWERNTDWTRFD